ncbi:right-handed parallel beta-helix repeat-containing protein [Alsobacter sp. SYSU BS001988]
MRAINITATPSTVGLAHGGLWWSSFERLEIVNFESGIELIGGKEDYLLPNQFLTFRDIAVVNSATTQLGSGLHIEGQAGQIVFQQVHFDFWAETGGIVIKLVQGGRVGGPVPAAISFETVTCQNGSLGVLVDGCQNISFRNCWFENLDEGARVNATSVSVNIDSCRFANSGRTGAAIRFEKQSSGAVKGSVFAGSQTKRSILIDRDADVSVEGNQIIWGAGPGADPR